MKTLTVFWVIFLFPFAVFAQSGGNDVLSQLSQAMANQSWDQAIVLFNKVINSDVAKAEMYYWTEVDKNSAVCPRMAYALADYYENARNYDKSYLFYKELTQMKSDDVNSWVSCANMQVMRGKEKDALTMYLQALKLDPNNLTANIFVGNYYYFSAEQERQKIETSYTKLSAPTRMQYARYKNSLGEVMSGDYSKAKSYLQNVLQHFPSTEAQKTLDKIQLIEKEVNR
ncbi:tetratricopeptide repeat protein [uncultured Bacteroides sp.]|uniref:tetratricopeptide repeat protein n=1 Tax=uncultured Bacteroides sp. TaxID=162156 RepID=UPI002AA8FC37|nr:tetratricopeptide repeat protein [uncultured Bacteroides sp.]